MENNDSGKKRWLESASLAFSWAMKNEIRKNQSHEARACVYVLVCVLGLDGQVVGYSASEKRHNIKEELKRERNQDSKTQEKKVKGKKRGGWDEIWAVKIEARLCKLLMFYILYFIWCLIGNCWRILSRARTLSDIYYKELDYSCCCLQTGL